MYEMQSVVVERSLGTVGFLTLSSWPPREPDNNEPIGYARYLYMIFQYSILPNSS